MRRTTVGMTVAGCLWLAACVSGGPAPPPTPRPWSLAVEGDDFSDLEPLRELLAGKRIVQLGENSHGVGPYNLAKARLVRFLHAQLGFEVLAFESSIYQCYLADLDAADAEPVRTLRGCLYGIWHTDEVLPLFDYLRSTRTGERPLHLAGFDVQPIGRNRAGRPDFLREAVARVDPVRAEAARELDARFLEIYDRGSRERRAFFREQGAAMADAYDQLAALLAGVDSAAAGVARQSARSMARYIRYQSAADMVGYVEGRDEGMADNLEFLLAELFPGKRIIVWGHNFHLRHANQTIPVVEGVFPEVAARTMGHWLAARRRSEMYTVGFYAYRGTAADNSRNPYEIEPAPEGTIEARLHVPGVAARFLDLSRAVASDPAAAWMFEPIGARFNGTDTLSLVLRDQYDAVVLIETAEPPRYLN